MTERCNPPRCVRIIGHEGDCASHWWLEETCGRVLRTGGVCARRRGHRPKCLTRRGMDLAAARKARCVAA